MDSLPEETPSDLIWFASWEKQTGVTFRNGFLRASNDLHHFAFVRRIWLELDKYIDQMNQDMFSNGFLMPLPPIDDVALAGKYNEGYRLN